MLIEYGVWVSRLMLGMVFGLAAAGKFLDGAATRKAVGEFGVPVRAVPAVAAGLPWLEAALAAGVLIRPLAGVAAGAAVLVLLVFTGAVLRLLRAGERPACACFGASEQPIGRVTLVRNGILLALAAVVLLGAVRYPDVPAILPADNTFGLTLFALLAAVLLWLVGELRAVRRRLDQQALTTLGAEGLPAGAVAPEFELRPADPGAAAVTLADLLAAGRGVLLVFVHPGCELCAALARELPRWQRRVADTLTIVAVGNGDPAEHAAWGAEQQLGEIPVLVQQGNEAALRYRVRGTPSAVLIDREGRIAAPVGRGAMAVRELIRHPKLAAPR
ncbi:MauE/DoxX family redox-associated membrane protein [Nocardia sp. NPDC057353]|uniref:MauE/DoxX family redox-associated membrane protein n=1 Tax=Nocardia sp. NPDC057353 TaxID=3346104 RepID=UPI00362927C7